MQVELEVDDALSDLGERFAVRACVGAHAVARR